MALGCHFVLKKNSELPHIVVQDSALNICMIDDATHLNLKYLN